MKRKLLAALMAATVLAVGGGVLAGCNPADAGHTHKYSTDWGKDETGHWHYATCDDLKEGDKEYKKDFAAHEYGDDDECDICHYVKEETPVTEHTIKLDANGGTIDGAETKNVETKNGKIESLPTPTAPEGHEFVGWYTEDVDGDEVTTDTVFTADGTIYAHYVVVYTITLDAGEGTLETTTVKAKGGKVEELPTPTAPGNLQFVGWFTEAEGGEEVTLETEFEEDTTIYAHYASVYTVHLEVGSQGVLPEGAEDTLTTEGGRLANLPTPVIDDETVVFLGWYTTGAEGDGVLVTEDYIFSGEEMEVTLYARYQQETLVTLSYGEGTLPEGALATMLTTNKKLAELPTPVAPENYWFKGWYTAESGGTVVNENTTLNGDAEHKATIYARYVAEVTITLSVTGGTIDGEKTQYTTKNGKIVLEEGERGLPNVTATKEHFLFFGWYNGTKAVDVANDVFETATTLTAKIAQEDGVWKSDGTFLATMIRNNGYTNSDKPQAVQYWLGEGKTVDLTAGDKVSFYIGGNIVTQLWITGAGVDKEKTPKPNVVDVTTTKSFKIFLIDYSGNGTDNVVEFRIPTDVTLGDASAIPQDAAAISIKLGNLDTITIYLKTSAGKGVTEAELGNYYIYTFENEAFGNWQACGKGQGKAQSTMTASAITSVPVGWIIRWGGIGADGNGGLQTANIENAISAGETYVITAASGAATITKIVESVD